MSRAKRIKKKYLDSGIFREDSPNFDAGVTVIYEMEEDYNAMVAAVKYIDSFIAYNKLKVKTFGDQDLINGMQL